MTAGVLGEPGPYGQFALSPDERRLAVLMPRSLWIMDSTSGARQLMVEAPAIADPRWSPDGTRVAFVSARGPNGSLNLYSVAIARPLELEALAEAPLMLQSGGWTPGGPFVWLQPRTQTVTRTLPGPPWFNLRGALMRAPGGEPALVTADADTAPLALSPDGNAIAYSRRLGGQWEVCLEVIATPRGCQPVGWSGTERPTEIIWRGDGRALIFRAGDNVIAASIRAGATLTPGAAVRLFQPRGTTGLAVTRDGARFLVSEARTQPAPTISVALNWTPDSAQ
jgi:Tol biopolymer transport system component